MGAETLVTSGGGEGGRGPSWAVEAGGEGANAAGTEVAQHVFQGLAVGWGLQTNKAGLFTAYFPPH